MTFAFQQSARQRRPSEIEVRRMHERMRGLYAELFKQRFGIEPPEPWDGGDSLALDEFINCTGSFDFVKVEAAVRSYFQSDGIERTTRPYQFLRELGKYTSGPLNARGVSKRSLAHTAVEVAERSAQVIAGYAAKEAADRAADVDARLARAIGLVAIRLTQLGFAVYHDATPGLPDRCTLLAVPRSANARSVVAARIRVSIDGTGDAGNGKGTAYLATVRETLMSDAAETLREVVFEPPLCKLL